MSDQQGEEDVKRWLNSALAGEPPMSLDRAEIFRRGRRKLRNRKLFQSGGVVVGVVAVVLGAVLVTDLAGGDSGVPPAGSSTGTAPPPAVTTTDQPLPPSTAVTVPPPSAKEPDLPEVEDARAGDLTRALLQSGLLPDDALLSSVPGEYGKPVFRKLHEGVYRIETDVRTQTAEGWLSVLVEQGGPDGGLRPTCQIPEERFDKCAVRVEFGESMTIAKQARASGEVRHWIRAVRRDGLFVTAISSNLSVRKKADGGWADKQVVLPESTMIKIAAYPWFSRG
jgi:hypothetical protein